MKLNVIFAIVFVALLAIISNNGIDANPVKRQFIRRIFGSGGGGGGGNHASKSIKKQD